MRKDKWFILYLVNISINADEWLKNEVIVICEQYHVKIKDTCDNND